MQKEVHLSIGNFLYLKKKKKYFFNSDTQAGQDSIKGENYKAFLHKNGDKYQKKKKKKVPIIHM